MSESGVIPRPEERDHTGCRQQLLDSWQEACALVGDGPPDEIVISTEPPLVMNAYVTGMQCPHGVSFWFEPTSDQIAKWRAAMPP